MTGNHKERAHSIFSASDSERWLNCAASVELEDGLPNVETPWSKEGTLAHEALESALLKREFTCEDWEMSEHIEKVANKIFAIQKAFGGTILVEKRVYAEFIHPEMFGTCDVIIAGDDRTLHIIDFKYGQGHLVRAEKNTQLIQYALSVAESYNWDEHFDFVKMWVMQPRIGKGSDSWRITMSELKNRWLPIWRKGVHRVMKGGNKPFPGSWCHWCKAKTTCPAKSASRVQELNDVFSQPLPGEKANGEEEETGTAQQARKKAAPKESKSRKDKTQSLENEEEISFY